MRTIDPGAVSHLPPQPHEPALDHARKIAAWVVRALSVPLHARRSTPALALHDQVIEHHVAIVTLCERPLFAPMLSLVRPTVDRHLRALWVERLSGEAIDRFLTGPDTPDTESLLRLLRKASRLGESEALLEAWERSPLYDHPALAGSVEHAGARRVANMTFVPKLHDVIDGLNFSAGLALLSTMRMAQLTGDSGAEQSARFRLGVMAGVGR